MSVCVLVLVTFRFTGLDLTLGAEMLFVVQVSVCSSRMMNLTWEERSVDPDSQQSSSSSEVGHTNVFIHSHSDIVTDRFTFHSQFICTNTKGPEIPPK